MKYGLLIFCILCCLNCKNPAELPSASKPVEQTVPLKEALRSNKSRDVWQRPSAILDLLGDLENKTVADIGAGTGFFVFRVLFRKAKVIAIDIDPTMLEVIESFKVNLSKEMQERLSTRLATPSDSKLQANEADVIMIINTIGYIDEKTAYLKRLYELLPKGGKMMIVDFKRKELPIEAPEQKYRVSLFEIENILHEAGFQTMQSNDSVLDYQYVVIAEK